MQCCPAAAAATTNRSTTTLTVNHAAQIDFDHVIGFPQGYTLHVGAPLWLPLPPGLNDIQVFVVPSTLVVRPTAAQLAGRE